VVRFMSSTLFSRGFSSMCELTNFLNLTQFVLFDVVLEGLSLISVCLCRLRSTIEWSDNRSDNELALIRLRAMFFVTAKSIKSARFLVSVCQYVVEAGETHSSLLPTFIMALYSCLAFGVRRRDPCCMCLAL